MKVGIEASAIFRRDKTGVSWYAYNLVKHMAAVMPDDQLMLCYISFITKNPERLSPSPANVRYRRISLFPGRIYNFLDHYWTTLPVDLLSRTRADVFLFPNFFRWPLLFCRKSVVVIHDLAFAEKPEFLVPRHQRYMSRRVPQSIRAATHVVAVSEHTKAKIVELFGMDASKVTVVVPALDHDLYKPSTDEAVAKVKAKYGINKKYLLFLGTTDPRKNVDGVLEAFAQLPEALRDSYQLVLGGATGGEWGWGWFDEKIGAIIDKLPKGSVVKTGYLDDKDKVVLMGGASIFVWPSHYEGWGMPVLEALACGTPVITARNSSLPEAGGDAAAYVEQTTDPSELCDLMQTLLKSPEALAKMSKAGPIYAAKFNWDDSARKMASLLRSL